MQVRIALAALALIAAPAVAQNPSDPDKTVQGGGKLPAGWSARTDRNAAMTNVNLFPNMVTQMVAIGEESGALDSMLSKVADFFEQEVDDAVEAMSSLMEPMIMVVLGTLIGGMVIAMYLPIFKMGSVV